MLGIIHPHSKYKEKQQEDMYRGIHGQTNGKTQKIVEWNISYDIISYDD